MRFGWTRCDWSKRQNLNILDESSTDEAECSRKVVSGRRVSIAIRSLVNVEVCSLNVLVSCMSHCSCVFLCIVVRH